MPPMVAIAAAPKNRTTPTNGPDNTPCDRGLAISLGGESSGTHARPMTMRAESFRQRAKECGALARTMTDQFSRKELERTAAHWLRLADGAELLEHLEQQRREREDSFRRRQE